MLCKRGQRRGGVVLIRVALFINGLTKKLVWQNLCYCERTTTERFYRSFSLRMPYFMQIRLCALDDLKNALVVARSR